MIAYSLYKNLKKDKNTGETSNSSTNNPQQSAGEAPAYQHNFSNNSAGPQQSFANNASSYSSPNQREQIAHHGNTARQQPSSQPIFCPLCRQEREVRYTAQGPENAVFSTCLTCETSWKCQ